MPRDFLPRNWDAFAVWMANFNVNLPKIAVKYGVKPATLTAVEADAAWVQYWVDAKATAKQQEKQLTDFMDEVANGDLGAPAQTAPDWTLPTDAPTTVVPTGIKKRIREIAAGIKAQRSVYSIADGEILGIVSVEETERPPAEYVPTLKISQLNDYHLGFEFRREGTDAVRFEVRHKGGDWKLLGDAAISPTDFLVTPLAPGTAEQVEIRAVYLKQYKPFGSFSPIYTATIAP